MLLSSDTGNCLWVKVTGLKGCAEGREQWHMANSCPGHTTPPLDAVWAQAPINLWPGWVSAAFLGLTFPMFGSSAWQMTGHRSARTVMTKSFLNSLSLLTVSGFIHHSVQERASQTRCWCEPRQSFWLYWSCLISISANLTLLFASLPLPLLPAEEHCPDDALTSCWLMAVRSGPSLSLCAAPGYSGEKWGTGALWSVARKEEHWGAG